MDPFMLDFFLYNKYILSTQCLWPFSSSLKIEKRKNMLAILSITINVIVTAADMNELFRNLDNIFAIIEGICDISACITSLIKCMVLLYRRKFIREIFMLMNDLYLNIPINERPEHIKKLDQEYADRAKLIVQILTYLYICPITFYCLNPWWILWKTGEFTFPFPGKFPYDTNHWSTYLPAYILECIMGYSLVAVLASTDALFASWILFMCSRVDTLQYSIEVASQEAADDNKKTPTFGKCVQYHIKLLRSNELIQNLFGVIFLFEFSISSILICLLLFLSTQTHLNDPKAPIFTSYLGAVIIQLFLYCYLGQKAQDKFATLEYGFYTNWYDTSVAYQKDVSLYLLRCQKPVILSIAKVLPINLETYYIIMKNSFSYFTMLLSMGDEE